PALVTDASLVVGIDGGGTRTVALLAREGVVIGRGEAGPSNLRAVGEARALMALDEAVARAFAAAGIQRTAAGSACLGVAGAGGGDGGAGGGAGGVRRVAGPDGHRGAGVGGARRGGERSGGGGHRGRAGARAGPDSGDSGAEAGAGGLGAAGAGGRADGGG